MRICHKAIAFCSIILAYAAYNSANTKWGDGFQGMKFQLLGSEARKLQEHKLKQLPKRAQKKLMADGAIEACKEHPHKQLGLRDSWFVWKDFWCPIGSLLSRFPEHLCSLEFRQVWMQSCIRKIGGHSCSLAATHLVSCWPSSLSH